MGHKVAILGASGYAGRELVELCRHHPRLRLVAAAARGDAGRDLRDVYPSAPSQALVPFAEVDFSAVETVFLCLPHGVAAEWARPALEAGCRVIDLSADYRLDARAVYGLTELCRPHLPEARLIANPGCYPTSFLLGLIPLARAGILSGTVIADSKSGVSGAGRAANVANLFGEVADNVRPYQVGNIHRHRPEMLAHIGSDIRLVFVPQVVPCFRGMLSNLYVDLPTVDVQGLYEEFYAGEPFIQVLPAGQVATMAHTRQTNRCALSLHPLPDEGKLLILSSLDNLLKGAAGQAVQNLNAAMGWPETEGLTRCGS